MRPPLALDIERRIGNAAAVILAEAQAAGVEKAVLQAEIDGVADRRANAGDQLPCKGAVIRVESEAFAVDDAIGFRVIADPCEADARSEIAAP